MAAILVKRNYGAYKGRTWAYGPRKKRNLRQGYIPRSGRGYTRTSGFYGRYNRMSLRNSSVSELKYIDTAINATAASTGTLLPASGTLVPIAVGTGPSQRIGRQVRVKSINAYLTLTKNVSDKSTDVIRLILLLDTQCNGAVPTVTDILSTANVNSFRNMANSKRFVVLKDTEQTITSSTYYGTNFGPVTRQLDIFRKVNYPIEYDQTLNTGAITTIRSNNLILLAISAYDTVSVIGTVRIRYDD